MVEVAHAQIPKVACMHHNKHYDWNIVPFRHEIHVYDPAYHRYFNYSFTYPDVGISAFLFYFSLCEQAHCCPHIPGGRDDRSFVGGIRT